METPKITIKPEKFTGLTYQAGLFSLTVRERDNSPEAQALGDDLIFRLSHSKGGKGQGKGIPRYQVENAMAAWDAALKKKDYCGPTWTVNVGGGPDAKPHTLAYIKARGGMFTVLYDLEGNLKSVKSFSSTNFPPLTPETHALFTHALQNFKKDLERLNT